MLDLFFFPLAHLQTVFKRLVLVSELSELGNDLVQLLLLLRDQNLFT